MQQRRTRAERPGWVGPTTRPSTTRCSCSPTTSASRSRWRGRDRPSPTSLMVSSRHWAGGRGRRWRRRAPGRRRAGGRAVTRGWGVETADLHVVPVLLRGANGCSTARLLMRTRSWRAPRSSARAPPTSPTRWRARGIVWGGSRSRRKRDALPRRLDAAVEAARRTEGCYDFAQFAAIPSDRSTSTRSGRGGAAGVPRLGPARRRQRRDRGASTPRDRLVGPRRRGARGAAEIASTQVPGLLIIDVGRGGRRRPAPAPGRGR